MSEQQKKTPPVSVFCSYASEDEALRNKLEQHLSGLLREGLITDQNKKKRLKNRY